LGHPSSWWEEGEGVGRSENPSGGLEGTWMRQGGKLKKKIAGGKKGDRKPDRKGAKGDSRRDWGRRRAQGKWPWENEGGTERSRGEVGGKAISKRGAKTSARGLAIADKQHFNQFHGKLRVGWTEGPLC